MFIFQAGLIHRFSFRHRTKRAYFLRLSYLFFALLIVPSWTFDSTNMADNDSKEFDSPAVVVGQKRGNTDNGGPPNKRAANITDQEGLYFCFIQALISRLYL